MAMRNPPVSDVLRRRLFMTASPYTRRDAAGIMASSSPLMEAVNRNAEQAQIIPAGLVSSLSGAASEGQSLPSSTEPDTTTTPYDDAIQREARKSKAKKDSTTTTTDDLTSISLNQDQNALIIKLLGGESNIDSLIKKNKDLLDKYAPTAKKPDEKRRAFTDFFLRMAAQGAAGEGVVAAAGKSAQPAFEGYMKREDEARAEKEKRDMLGLTLGLQEAQKEEAARQAIGLKMLENKDPSTLKLAKAIQAEEASKGNDISITEAIQRTYRATTPGFQAKAFDTIMSTYPGADPLLVSAFLNGSINISDLALGIGSPEDVGEVIDRLNDILRGTVGTATGVTDLE